MRPCPNCGQLAISEFSQLSPPYDGRVQCSYCKADVKVKMTPVNFILPIYLLVRGFIGLVFGIHLDLGFAAEMSLMLALFLVQLKLLAYEVVEKRR